MMCCGVLGYSDYMQLGRISVDQNTVSSAPPTWQSHPVGLTEVAGVSSYMDSDAVGLVDSEFQL